MVDLSQTASPFEVIYSVGAGFALVSFMVLLLFAIVDATHVSKLPDGHPDRMIAGDSIVNESIRLLLGAGILAVGLAALVTLPAAESIPANPSVLGVTLFVVLLWWEVLLVLWGLKDVWFRRRLFKRMATVRLICAESTFATCPFVKALDHDHTMKPEAVVEPPPVPPEDGL